MMKAYAVIAGAWVGILWFFTFRVARVLFAAFPREQAGAINRTLLPDYFFTVIALGLLATILLWLQRRDKRDTAALVLQIMAVGALAAIPLFIQPVLVTHAPGTPGFARWHGVSMALNLFSLIAAPAASLLVLGRRKERNT